MSRTRLTLVLVILLAVIAGAVVLVQRSRDAGEHVLGGPLIPLEMAEVNTVLVARDGQQFRFERQRGSAWSLGGALEDWVDPYALGRSLVRLDGAMGGRVLAGTEPEDRRYEFNGPRAVRLTLLTPDGQETRLSLGAANPVTGHVYASGAGRSACFPVESGTRDLVAGLPQNARLMSVLPPVLSADLDRIELTRGGRRDVFRRSGADWWLVVGGPDDPRVPPAVRAYGLHYRDKQRDEGGEHLVLAERRLIAELVATVTRTKVTNLVEPRDAAGFRSAWGLDEPWQGVRLQGPGIDPDPVSATPDELVVEFGTPLDPQTVPALRRGNPLLVAREAVSWLELPPGDLLDVRALEIHPLEADSVVLAGPGGVLARAGRQRDRAVRFDGRLQWDSLLAVAGDEGAHASVRSMIVGLERWPVLTTLPPTDDPAVLREDERLVLTVVGTDPSLRHVWHVGWLAVDRVSGGAAALAAEDGVEGPAGLWNPETGRLVQVPSWLMTTGRRLSN